MLVLLMAAWLMTPLYPLNPVQQDTLNHVNMHITAGISGPTRFITPGPEFTAKYEVMFHHPFVLRVAFDYRFGKIESILYPNGDFHGTTYSNDIFYYRGTDKLTGYFGLGLVYVKNYINLDDNVSLLFFESDRVVDVYMNSALGYRLTLGLRLYQNYSLELAITEVSPSLVTKSQLSENQYVSRSEKIRLNNVRFTVGYLIPLGW